MFFLGGLELVVPVLVLGLIVLAVVAVATGRRDPDPAGHRPYAIYLFTASFVSLFVSLFSAAAAVSAVVRTLFPGTTGFGEDAFERDAGVGQLVTAGLLGPAYGIFRFHWTRAEGLRGAERAARRRGPRDRGAAGLTLVGRFSGRWS